jgi:phage-related protein
VTDTNMGSAYVTVHAITSMLKKEIGGALEGTEKDFDKAGKKSGDKFSKSFSKSTDEAADSLKQRLGAGLNDLFSKTFAGGTGGLQLLLGALPLITSGLSAVGGVLSSLIGSLGKAASSGLAAVGVIGSLVQVALVGKLAFGGLSEAIAGNAEAMAKLGPEATAVAGVIQGLKGPFDALKSTIQEAAFDGLATQFAALETTISAVTPALQGTGTQLRLLISDLLTFATEAQTLTQLGQILEGNNAIFSNLRAAAVPVLAGLLNLFQLLQPAALRLSVRISELAARFRAWTENLDPTVVDGFMQRAEASAGLLLKVIRNIGSAFKTIFGDASVGDGVLKSLESVTARFDAWVQKLSEAGAITEWAEKGQAAFSGLGKVIGTLASGGGLGALFNPDIITGFFDILNSVLGAVGKLIAPIGAAIGSAFKQLGPLFGQLATALGPLLAGIGAVISQIIKQAIPIVAGLLKVIIPVVSFISGVLGPVLTKLSPIIAFLILAFTTWGAKIVSLIPIVGKFLAPLVAFSSWIVGKLFPILGKVAGFFFKTWWGAVKVVLGAFGKIISVVSSGVARVFGFISKGLGKVSGFFKALWDGVSRIFSTAWTKLSTIVSSGATRLVNFLKDLPRRITDFFKNLPDAFLTIGKNLMSGLRDGIQSGFAWIRDKLSGLGKLVPDVLKKFLGIKSPSRVMMELGRNISMGLAQGIAQGSGAVRSSMTSIAGQVSGQSMSFGDVAAASRTSSGGAAAGALAAGSSSSAETNVTIQNNYMGPTIGSERKREIDWAIRYATRFGAAAGAGAV